MKLLVISHTAHYLKDETITGWAPTVKEIDFLSTLFDSVTHIAPLHSGGASASSAAYESPNIIFKKISPAGGISFLDKLGLILKIPQYIHTVLKEMPKADVIHIRCPANISLIGVILVILFKKAHQQCWIKYAGDWKPSHSDALSCRFQRWILSKNWHRGHVTVNGQWPNQPVYIHSFLNPCVTRAELLKANELTGGKIMSLAVKLLFVGHMIQGKGADKMIDIALALRERGVLFQMDFIGDGPLMDALKKKADDFKLTREVVFHGWKNRDSMARFYERAHILCLPSQTEGWPKVIGEAMVYSVIPLASPVGSIPYYLNKFRLGKVNAADDIEGFCRDIQAYAVKPDTWKEEAVLALKYAELFTYEKYLDGVRGILKL